MQCFQFMSSVYVIPFMLYCNVSNNEFMNNRKCTKQIVRKMRLPMCFTLITVTAIYDELHSLKNREKKLKQFHEIHNNVIGRKNTAPN